ncbi:MAG: hypothetical protein ACAH83_04860 [Alphaproteobacteria bacterium]
MTDDPKIQAAADTSLPPGARRGMERYLAAFRITVFWLNVSVFLVAMLSIVGAIMFAKGPIIIAASVGCVCVINEFVRTSRHSEKPGERWVDLLAFAANMYLGYCGALTISIAKNAIVVFGGIWLIVTAALSICATFYYVNRAKSSH